MSWESSFTVDGMQGNRGVVRESSQAENLDRRTLSNVFNSCKLDLQEGKYKCAQDLIVLD